MSDPAINVEKLVREYIQPLVHLSLATVQGGRPWVCEVHFAYDDDLNLYFRSLASRRHSQEIAQNPQVSGTIVKQYALGERGVGVSFEGAARRLEAGEEQQKAFECTRTRLGAGDDILAEAQREGGHQFYKVSVETWYLFGRFGEAPAQKYQLAWRGGTGSR